MHVRLWLENQAPSVFFMLQGNNHKLLSADEEKRLAVQIQSILPYEEKFDELHSANMAAAGIAEEGSDRPNAAHPDAEAGKYDPTFREWATACGRADDIPAFERQIWEGRQVHHNLGRLFSLLDLLCCLLEVSMHFSKGSKRLLSQDIHC